jgi:hypothetical protein
VAERKCAEANCVKNTVIPIEFDTAESRTDDDREAAGPSANFFACNAEFPERAISIYAK